MAPTRVAVIINPISGTGGRLHVARDRAELAASLMAAAATTVRYSLQSVLATAASWPPLRSAQGASLVLAWGGDGTVNEVGSALAFRDATLG